MISLEDRSDTVLGVVLLEHGFTWFWRFAQRFENHHIVTNSIKKEEETCKQNKKNMKFPIFSSQNTVYSNDLNKNQHFLEKWNHSV